jgi:hypothetical protein
LELTALHPTKSKEQSHRELAHGCRWVDPEVYYRDLRACLVHALYEAKRIGDPRSRQAVKVRNRKASGLTCADAREHRIQPRPVKLAARLVQILVPGGNSDAACISPLLDAVALNPWADEGVPFSPARLRNPDIAV